MIITDTSPTLLTIFIFILFFIGVVVLTWGRKLPGKGSWLVWAGVITLFVGATLDARVYLLEQFKTRVWMTGWIWARGEIGAITVGVHQDALSLAMAALSALVAGALLLHQRLLLREPRPEKSLAAVAISTSGVALAWNSLTPWLVFVGLVFTAVGGFISLGSRWDSDEEADIASRFIRERILGFLLAFVGACLLATSRTALILSSSDAWTIEGDPLVSTWFGSSLLVVGLFVQMQSFPFKGWVVAGSEVFPPLTTLLNQVFPAWAAFSLLLRMHPQLAYLGLFPSFGWIAVFSALLTILSGMFQSQWRLSLGAWLSAGLSLSVALLASSGPLSAIGLLLGVSLGALALSGAAVALEPNCIQSVTFKKRALWLKVILFLGASAGTGMIGFVSATGGIHWILETLALPEVIAPFLFVFFLYLLLGWKVAWNTSRLNTASEATWLSVFGLTVWIVLSLGLVWTGTLTGEVIPQSPDRFMASLFSVFFGQKPSELPESSDFYSASGLYWGVALFAFFAAFWTSGGKEDRWTSLFLIFPNVSRFLAKGYAIDGGVERLLQGVRWIGNSVEMLVDYKIWNEWLPRGLCSSIKFVGVVANRVDIRFSAALGIGLRKMVEIPAKILQLIQTGDLRWYLFFALGSGFALLTHFLKA